MSTISCLRLGVVPTSWKCSTIVPLPKVANPTNLNDLRPIALTNVFAKLLERVALRRVQSTVTSVISAEQHAYKRSCSTTTALVSMIHSWLQFLDNNPGSCVRVGLLDFSKAFDSVDPNILAGKLVSLNFEPWFVSLVWNFLTCRSQMVKVRNDISPAVKMSRGIPQGTILGPTLFSVMVNDLTAIHCNSQFVRYADDQSLSHFRRDSSDDRFAEELNSVLQWCKLNGLSLNAKKTKELIVSLSHTSAFDFPCVVLDGTNIEQVFSAKILGVTVDRKLSFWEHAQAVSSRCKSLYFLLRRLRNTCHLSDDEIVYVIQTVLLPIVLYAYPAWCCLNTSGKNIFSKIFRDIEKISHGKISTNLAELGAREILRLGRLATNPSHPLHAIIPSVPSHNYNTRRAPRPHLRARSTKYLNHFLGQFLRLID